MKRPYCTLSFTVLIYTCLMIFAFEAQAAIDSSGLFDAILTRYSAAASSWAAVITTAATWLFWTLVVISMVWTFGMMALRKADLGDFFAEFLKFTISTGFFWWLLINGPSFSTSLYASLRTLAGNATGLGSALSPSGIVDIGFAIFATVLDKSSAWEPVDTFCGMFFGVAILVILALIGVNMLLLLISGWILAYGGVFFLGFGGARWTTDMAINYYKTALGLAAQLMAMVLLIGIGKTFLDDYYSRMSEGSNFKEMAIILVVVIILFVLVNKVPQLIAGIITGASIGGVGIGQYGAGAALGAAGMAAATIAAGGAMIGAGAKGAAGGAQALMAAFSQASENIGSGSDMGIGAGNDGSTGSAGVDGSAGSDGNTPFAEAAGFGGGESSGGSSSADSETATSNNDQSQEGGNGGEAATKSQGDGSSSGFFSSAAKIGKITAEASGILAKGATDVIKGKAAGIKESTMASISNTTGGKIAAAIKSNSAPTFANNSLSGDNSEVSEFVNKS